VKTTLNAFTVDVEDYYHVSAFEGHIDRQRWHEYESRVGANTRRILQLLEDHQVRATFFILGWVAQQDPGLVRDIDRAGHEIASHSFWHRLVYRQTPDEFRQDLRQSRDVLEQIIGRPVTAFRAPSFSITRRSLWALEILVEEGFQLDSSIYPVYHDRYGIPDAKPHVHQIHTPSGSLWEFPPAVVRMGRLNLPVSGGGYFRLYPEAWTRRWLSRINHTGRPFVFYIHPWEVDPHQPRLKAGSRVSRFRHYVNLGRTEAKLKRMFREFRFGGIKDVVASYNQTTLIAAV
jgi:polysaccharide deacetylase family protein (PEP-CTERM system associated)